MNRTPIASPLLLVGRDAIETLHGSEDKYCEVCQCAGSSATRTVKYCQTLALIEVGDDAGDRPLTTIGHTGLKAREEVFSESLLQFDHREQLNDRQILFWGVDYFIAAQLTDCAGPRNK